MEEKYEIGVEHEQGTPVSEKMNNRLKLIVKVSYFIACLVLFIVGMINTIKLFIEGEAIIGIVLMFFLIFIYLPITFLIYWIVKKMNPQFVMGAKDKLVIRKKK